MVCRLLSKSSDDSNSIFNLFWEIARVGLGSGAHGLARHTISESTDFYGDASMDAASNIKSFLVALAASFGTAGFVYSDDADATSPVKVKQFQAATGLAAPCVGGVCCEGQVCVDGKCSNAQCSNRSPCVNNACSNESVAVCESVPFEGSQAPSGIAAFVSEWLLKSPKFSAEVAIHFGQSPVSPSKLRDVPVNVYVQEGQNGRFALGGSVTSDLGVAGNFVLEERNFDLLKRTGNPATRNAVPQIAKPMRFTQRIPRIQLGELVNDVIICGHRICSGNKCFDVKDEPVAGTACDKTEEESNANENGEDEPILVLPIAPPAPPAVDIARIGNDNGESEAASILRSSGLGKVNISVPVTTIVDLLVAKTELSTRLEMTSQLMDERQEAMQQIQSLANRNANLSTQLAVAEARNQMSDALTASVVDRAELAIKLASIESKSGKLQSSGSVIQTIQEDLSNIRRQIALLRRSPVPFAPSYVGLQSVQPYVPTAQLPAVQLSKDAEATCAGEDADSVHATTVK